MIKNILDKSFQVLIQFLIVVDNHDDKIDFEFYVKHVTIVFYNFKDADQPGYHYNQTSTSFVHS